MIVKTEQRKGLFKRNWQSNCSNILLNCRYIATVINLDIFSIVWYSEAAQLCFWSTFLEQSCVVEWRVPLKKNKSGSTSKWDIFDAVLIMISGYVLLKFQIICKLCHTLQKYDQLLGRYAKQCFQFKECSASFQTEQSRLDAVTESEI